MNEKRSRRGFLKGAVAASAIGGLALSLEEEILLAQQKETGQGSTGSPPQETARGMPTGKIGKLTLSRLICGGNLVAGYAHAKDGSRSLAYVSKLMLSYFTDEKMLQLFELAEASGVNAVVLNNLERDFKPIAVLNRYWKERGGKIQWIAQCNPEPDDFIANTKIAIDHGAVAAFAQGGFGDRWSQDGRIELLGKFVDFAKQNGLAAGIGGHTSEMLTAVEKSGIQPDFYFKTLNNVDYACPTPDETIRIMSQVNRPWIAYKILGAGRANPVQGFRYAFQNGADFACVGMFDFQVTEDVQIVNRLLPGLQNRPRPWCA